jgi:glycosyltransferase involved in cell wall biosynthesis
VGIELSGRAYRRERAELRSLVERLRPDVVHTHGFRTDVIDAPVARAMAVPTVTTVHGFTGGGWKARLYETLQVRAHRSFDAVVAVSRPLLDHLLRRGVPRDRLHLHPNAWKPGGPWLSRREARERLSLDEGNGPAEVPGGPRLREGVTAATSADAPVHLGWVGRMSREKAPDVFIEALGGLRERSWTASMVGDGPLRGDLELRCAELGVSDRVTWHGNVTGAGALMRAFDVFVLSSRTEGTPIVLLEAMAAGVPIVATDVGGVSDLVGEAAVLADGDSPRSLAAAVGRVLDNPGLRGRLGTLGTERLDARGDEEAWLAGYERIYDRACARSSAE